MDKLCSVAGIVFTHFLFLAAEMAFVMALYTAASERDRSCLIVALLCRIAKQCMIPMWKHEKLIYKEAFGHGKGNY